MNKKKFGFGSIAMAFMLFFTASNASAQLIGYDILWTGFSGNTMTGMFSYDDADAADGFVRDRHGDLASLMLTSGDYGLSWTWDGSPADPFNFNFVVATESFPFNGIVSSTEGQWWNGTGSGIGLGVHGSDGRLFLVIDGRPTEATQSLVVTRKEAEISEPAVFGLFGIGLLGFAFARQKQLRGQA